MNPSLYFSPFSLPSEDPRLPADQQRFHRTLYAALTFIPTLSLFISLGFAIIFILGLVGLLDSSEPRLLINSGLAIVASAAHIPLFRLFQRGQLNKVALFLLIINSTLSAVQIFVWQGILWFPLLATLFPIVLFTIQRGMSLKYRLACFFYGLLCLIVIIIADRLLAYERMNVGSSLSNMAALAIYLMVAIAMVVLILLNSQINFHSISSRLATTFTFIALLSSITILIIAALANIYFDRQRIFLALNAASKVRSDQVQLSINDLERDVSLSLADPVIINYVYVILAGETETNVYLDAFERVRSFSNQLQQKNSKFQEIFIFDSNGKNLLSTYTPNIGLNLSSFNFFSNANMGINYGVENGFPGSYDQTSIIIVKPFLKDGNLLGAIGVRANFDNIKQILAATTGLGDTAETYLVGYKSGFMIPLTNTRRIVEKINSKPAEQALMFQSNYGSGIWYNYGGTRVLGSYVRIPAIKSVLIAEIEQQEVTQKTINISLTNAIIGIFTLLLTFSIVIITSRSIGVPIVELSGNAARLANGEFEVRITTTRNDEIGALATSFNLMAEDLESLIKNLESKVEERTKELSKQTNYLRVAAEVARDATTAQTLDELLNRAAKLVLDRFGFYHTGIFLLDGHKEYAVLRASPTAAGMELLSRNHRLKVGQVGIVGFVAANGTPRISLDTGQDPEYFNNPLLPNTRSEAALPLKVNDELIGVLDVQSDQPQAFTQDDINILQVMADQLALAIQRVQLAQNQEENLRQLTAANQRFTFESWSKLNRTRSITSGYSFDGMHLLPFSNMPEDIQGRLSQGRSVLLSEPLSGDRAALAVPVKIRDQIIGILKIQFNGTNIPADTITLIEETANQLAIALENARLYTETQKAAERERAVSQITSKIRSTNDPNEMIQIALNEIKQTLRANDAKILPYTPTPNHKKN